MARKNTDYIPTKAESLAEIEAMRTFMSENPDPRSEYIATYTLCGKQYTESVMAFNLNDAIQHVKQQCSMVGIYPIDLTVKEA